MKCKKYSYILVLILMLIVGINKTYAEESKTCYYISSDDNLKISLRIGYNMDRSFKNSFDPEQWSKTTIWKTADGNSPMSTQDVENWFKNKSVYGTSLSEIYKDREAAMNDSNPACPRYIVYTSCSGFLGFGTSEKTYATNSNTLASSAANAASSKCKYSKYADNYKNGVQITADTFFAEFTTNGLIEYDKNKGEYTCADMDLIFGSKNDDGVNKDPDGDGTPSIRYMVNQILGYVRIIVPILIILLGTLDFAKAVLAGKEDNMKKAQSTFVKRVIAGVVVFFIPTLVDIIMGLADIVWAGEYTHCDF